MFDISFGGAGLAGLLSFLSPCILPIVPFYLCYMAGTNMQALQDDGQITGAIRTKAILSAILFSAGVILVFMAFGATASVFGQLFREWFSVLRYIAAAMIIVMGLHFLGVIKIGFLYRQFRMETGTENKLSYVGAFLMGLAFAFGWTPCVGPVLAAILMTAASTDTALKGAMLLFTYGVGMTFPFVIAAAFIGPFMRWMGRFRKHLGTVEKIMGLFLILFGILIATNMINYIAEWMLSIAPDIGTLR